MPKIFFNNSQNFDSSAFSIGIGLVTNFIKIGQHNMTQVGTYQYTREQEALLVEMQQIRNEIKEIKLRSQQIEDELDFFYLSDFDEKDSQFKKKYRQIQYLENKLKRLDRQLLQARNRLDSLKQRWDSTRRDQRSIQDHIGYLRQQYYYSPYGLHYRDGYFLYDDTPYHYRYYHYGNAYYNTDDSTNSGGSGAWTTEEKEAYLQKKKEYLENRKNRTGESSSQESDRQDR